MNKKVQNILGYGLIIAFALNEIIPMNTNIPSQTQAHLFALTMLLFLFNQKNIVTDGDEIVARTNKKKYYVQIAAIYIQLIFMVNSLGLDTGIINIIVSIAALVSGIYGFIKR